MTHNINSTTFHADAPDKPKRKMSVPGLGLLAFVETMRCIFTIIALFVV
jgi:hypothetical protein